MVSHNRLVGCIPPGQELCQLLLAYSAEPSLHDVMGVSARRRHHSPRYRMIYDRIYIYIYIIKLYIILCHIYMYIYIYTRILCNV